MCFLFSFYGLYEYVYYINNKYIITKKNKTVGKFDKNFARVNTKFVKMQKLQTGVVVINTYLQ